MLRITAISNCCRCRAFEPGNQIFISVGSENKSSRWETMAAAAAETLFGDSDFSPSACFGLLGLHLATAVTYCRQLRLCVQTQHDPNPQTELNRVQTGLKLGHLSRTRAAVRQLPSGFGGGQHQRRSRVPVWSCAFLWRHGLISRRSLVRPGCVLEPVFAAHVRCFRRRQVGLVDAQRLCVRLLTRPPQAQGCCGG